MKYSIIPNQKRTILLHRVLQNNQPIKIVAQQLKIKFPSAKSIVRTYKKTGRVFYKKKTRKAKSHSLNDDFSQRIGINSLEGKNDLQIMKCENSEKNVNQVQQQKILIRTVQSLPENFPFIVTPFTCFPMFQSLFYCPYNRYS